MSMIDKSKQRVFHRTLYAAQLQTVTLLKRDDDQRQGTVRSIILYETWRSSIYKTGEPLQHDMVSDHRTVWHLARVELDRIGVAYISPIDRIVDDQQRYWQPESTTNIDIKLFELHVHFSALRVDPPLQGRDGQGYW